MNGSFERVRRLWKWGRLLLPISVIAWISLSQVTGEPKEALQTTKSYLAKNIEYAKSYQLGLSSETSAGEGLELTAAAAILVDAETGEILLDKHADMQLPPASVAKLMTALVSYEQYGPEKILTVPREALETEGNRLILKAGEKLSVRDLLHGLLMVSANDVAEVLARNYPGGKADFIAAMNEKAGSLGLAGSRFTNPSGLDEENFHVSARDMATLARLIYLNHPEILEIMGKQTYQIKPSPDNEYHYVYAISDLVKQEDWGIRAVKNGYTEQAKTTLVAVAKRGGREIILVFLGSLQPFPDALKMLEWCDVKCRRI